MKIEIAILEANEQDFSHLASLLTKWSWNTGNGIEISRFTDGKIIEEFKRKKYDLLFAEIRTRQAKTAAGINICKTLRMNGYNNEIIVLTDFREYVFEGYNIQALNYLIKPVSQDTLSSTLNQYMELRTKDYYYLQDRGTINKIRYNDILFIQKQKHNIVFHTCADVYYERATLYDVTKKLPSCFVRCHKSYILNLSHVQSVAGNMALLSDSSTQIIGRKYLTAIRNALSNLSRL